MDLELYSYLLETDFNWTRFWSPADVPPIEYDFLPDPTGFLGNKLIVPFEKIKHIPFLILLGNPGIGKTRTILRIAQDIRNSGTPCIYAALGRYGSFDKLEARLRKDHIFQQWEKSTTVLQLFLDGLDDALL